MLGEPLEVDIVVRGIGDDQVLDVPGVVDDEVIDDVAVIVEHEGVLRLTEVRDLGKVVGQHPLQEVECLEPKDPKLGHVSDVEDACRSPDSPMLFDDPRVLNRHLPAGEWHHTCAERQVLIVERRALQLL